MVAHSKRIASHSCSLEWGAEAFQKNMIPIEDGGRERVMLGGPDESRITKLFSDAVTVHVTADDRQPILRGVLDDHVRLIATLRPPDLGWGPEVETVDADGVCANLDIGNGRDPLLVTYAAVVWGQELLVR